MARMAAAYALSDVAPTTATLGATTSSAAILLGAESIWAFVATQDMHLRYGVDNTVAASSAAFFRIPANTMFTLLMPPGQNYVRIFNAAGSNGTYHLVPLVIG